MRTIQTSALVSLLFLLALCVPHTSVAWAAPADEDISGENWATKEIRGEISSKGFGGLSIVYSRNEEQRAMMEVYFPYSNDTVLAGYGSPEDIREGDNVVLTYRETGDKSLRALRKVRFISRKPKIALLTQAEIDEQAEEGDPVL